LGRTGLFLNLIFGTYGGILKRIQPLIRLKKRPYIIRKRFGALVKKQGSCESPSDGKMGTSQALLIWGMSPVIVSK